MRTAFTLAAFQLLAVSACAQWVVQPSGTTARLRGVSAAGGQVAWASGVGGTVLRTVDDGATWVPRIVPDAGGLDFRDIEAFGPLAAYVLSIGEGKLSRIYKTTDGGTSWTLQHTNPDPKGFLDALAFWDPEHGLALGDPVGGRFVIRTTVDGGKTWTGIAP